MELPINQVKNIQSNPKYVVIKDKKYRNMKISDILHYLIKCGIDANIDKLFEENKIICLYDKGFSNVYKYKCWYYTIPSSRNKQLDKILKILSITGVEPDEIKIEFGRPLKDIKEEQMKRETTETTETTTKEDNPIALLTDKQLSLVIWKAYRNRVSLGLTDTTSRDWQLTHLDEYRQVLFNFAKEMRKNLKEGIDPYRILLPELYDGTI